MADRRCRSALAANAVIAYRVACLTKDQGKGKGKEKDKDTKAPATKK